MTGVRRAWAIAGVLVVFVGRPLWSQSLTSGAVAGTVRDSLGGPLADVLVSLIQRGTGINRLFTTVKNGAYSFTMVAPGPYDILVEHLGYLPRRINGVVLTPGRTLRVDVAILAVEGRVRTVDSTQFRGGVLASGSAGAGQWFGDLALRALPSPDRQIGTVARYATNADQSLQVEGLSSSLSQLTVDGVPFVPARSPVLSSRAYDWVAFPVGFFDRAQLLTAAPDLEWIGSGGGFLSGYTRGGSHTVQLTGYGDYTGSALSSSQYFNTGSQSYTVARAGLLLTGPIIKDTASYAVGLEYRHLQLPRPPAWVSDSLTAPFVAVARDSFGVDLRPYQSSYLSTSNELVAFGRVDWALTGTTILDVRGTYASTDATNPDLGVWQPVGLGSTLTGTDISAAATVTSIFSRVVSQEFRVSANATLRDYGASTEPLTTVVDGGWSFGSTTALPGRFRRNDYRVSEALFLALGHHTFKFGGLLAASAHEQTYASDQVGTYVYAGVNDFAAGQGVYSQTVGRLPFAQFGTSRLSGYLQDGWNAALGFDVMYGFRVDYENWPESDVHRNDSLRIATGLDNSNVTKGRVTYSPRFGFRWDVNQQHEWLLQGTAGVYAGEVDPGAWAEVIVQDGGQNARRGAGDVGVWPVAPDSTRAPVRGPVITVFGPDLQSPSSRRATLGISRGIGPFGAVSVSGTYRFTDYLLRRHDLNRVLGTNGTDQYGRPLYGTLAQQGSDVYVVPGSNVRLGQFDRIWSLDPDGFSKYLGVTVGIERQAATGLGFLLSYTYSQTTDNVMDGRGAGPNAQLWPFPDSLAGQDWSKGRSDYDIPHRFVAAVSYALPTRGIQPRLSAVFQYRSGYPYTPGFRNGVDVNGDGSGSNDPAFVDDKVPGAAAVINANSCLGTQVGQFAERNSCRDPAVKTLDLRLLVGLPHAGGLGFSIVLDAFNVLESNTGVYDHALYLIDKSKSLSYNPATGVTTIPLIANPNFGNVLMQESGGRWGRIGLQVAF